MSKKFLKKFPILCLALSCGLLITNPAYSVLEDLDENVSSITQKIISIQKKVEQGTKHTFIAEERGPLSVSSSGSGPRGFKCTHCRRPESECFGIGGGALTYIEDIAKKINEQLSDIEGSD